jgi:hypothetical protein
VTMVDDELVPAITALRAIEARMASVLIELQARSDRGDLPAARVREQIIHAIRSGRQRADGVTQ